MMNVVVICDNPDFAKEIKYTFGVFSSVLGVKFEFRDSEEAFQKNLDDSDAVLLRCHESRDCLVPFS